MDLRDFVGTKKKTSAAMALPYAGTAATNSSKARSVAFPG